MPHCAASSRPGGGLGVERVALEVEEEVAVVGAREGAERRRRDHLVRRAGGGALGGLRRRDDRAGAAGNSAGVPAGLSSCRRACVRSIPNVSGFMPAGVAGVVASASIDSIPAARRRSRCTGRMPATSSRSRAATTSASHVAQRPQAMTPSSPRGSPQAIGAPAGAEIEAAVGDERRQPLAPEAEDGEQIVDRVPAHAAVAEQQLDVVGALDAEPIELVDVGGELHQRRDPGMTGELGVLHHPAAGVVAHQEVGEPDEVGGRERRLVDHGGVGGQRRDRLRHRVGQGDSIR